METIDTIKRWQATGSRRSAKGTGYCEEACMVPIRRKADIAIACCGGYPKDMNLYQASKGYAVGIDAVKPGGAVILLARCEDGMGADPSVSIITDYDSHLEREKKMREAFEPEAYSGYYICEMANKYRLMLVSDYQPAEELEKKRSSDVFFSGGGACLRGGGKRKRLYLCHTGGHVYCDKIRKRGGINDEAQVCSKAVLERRSASYEHCG